MTSKITLPWMGLIRTLEDKGYNPITILALLKAWGEGEENRITKEFEKKWTRILA